MKTVFFNEKELEFFQARAVRVTGEVNANLISVVEPNELPLFITATAEQRDRFSIAITELMNLKNELMMTNFIGNGSAITQYLAGFFWDKYYKVVLTDEQLVDARVTCRASGDVIAALNRGVDFEQIP